MNGRASSYEWPSTVTWSSCMHSSSAACVFGEALLISSTSSRFVKTGPGRNSNSFDRWLKTLTPVTSEGSRSGVNCRREKEQSIERASAFASVVFPTPGRSSMIRWPSASRQRTVSCKVSSGAWTTPPRFATIRRIDSSEPIRVAALRSGSSITSSPPASRSRRGSHLRFAPSVLCGFAALLPPRPARPRSRSRRNRCPLLRRR